MRTLRAPTIRLRDGASERLREIFDCTTYDEVADRMEIDPTQLSRVRNGRSDVGANFLARVLIALLAKGIETADLFEVVDVYGRAVPMMASCPGSSRRELAARPPERRAS